MVRLALHGPRPHFTLPGLQRLLQFHPLDLASGILQYHPSVQKHEVSDKRCSMMGSLARQPRYFSGNVSELQGKDRLLAKTREVRLQMVHLLELVDEVHV